MKSSLKSSFKYIAGGAIIIASLLDNANAIPAFARQMGVTCSVCHSENGYPALTRFGREFKASGYTMVGSEKLIGGGKTLSDKLISLPSALNMSVVGGASINGGDGSTPTTVATDDGFGVFLGGRINEHIGTFVEMDYNGGGNGGTFSLNNFLVPITYKVGENYYGIEPYFTDGHTTDVSGFFGDGDNGHEAVSEIGARDTYGAKGLSLYDFNPNYFINYVVWANGNQDSTGTKFANYFRVAYTPQVGIWDLEFGARYFTGTTNLANDNIVVPGQYVTTDAYSMDFNAMGKVSNMPLHIGMSYADAEWKPNSLFTTNSDHKDGTSFVFDTKLGVIPRTLVAMVHYTYDDHVQDSNDKVKTTQLALRYFITENAHVQPYYDIISGNSGGNGANDNAYGVDFEVAF